MTETPIPEQEIPELANNVSVPPPFPQLKKTLFNILIILLVVLLVSAISILLKTRLSPKKILEVEPSVNISPKTTLTPTVIPINYTPLLFGKYKIVLPEGYGWTQVVNGNLQGQSPEVYECEAENNIPLCQYVAVTNENQRQPDFFISNHKYKSLNSGIVLVNSEDVVLETGGKKTVYQFYWQLDDENPANFGKNERGEQQLISFEGCPQKDLCFVCDRHCLGGFDKIKQFINEIEISEN